MHNSDFYNKLIERSFNRIKDLPLSDLQNNFDPEIILAIQAQIISTTVMVLQELEHMVYEETYC